MSEGDEEIGDSDEVESDENETAADDSPKLVTPLATIKFNEVLNAHEFTRHSLYVDAETGEQQVEMLTDEQVAKLLGCSIDLIKNPVVATETADPADIQNEVSDEEVLNDEEAEVEMEDLTEEECPRYQDDNDDLPGFEDLFKEAAAEELGRRVPNKDKDKDKDAAQSSSNQERIPVKVRMAGRYEVVKEADWPKKQKTEAQVAKEKERDDFWNQLVSSSKIQQTQEQEQEWRKFLKENPEKFFKPSVPEPKFKEFYDRRKLKKGRPQGKILSWAYLGDLNVYAVKREYGVDYFKYPVDFKTLPYFEFMQIARLRMLYSDETAMSKLFQQLILAEFKLPKWVKLRPQFPKVTVHPRKLDSRGLPLKIFKYRQAKTMRVIPVRKMPQNFHCRFQWWVYSDRTEEAIIVLRKEGESGEGCWELIRVLDPLWLRNLSEMDVATLHANKIHYKPHNEEQAMQCQRVVDLCFEKKLNTGSL